MAWINEEHTWRVDPIIPACWAELPHIVHELAVVACKRHEALSTTTPTELEDWHRYTLPMFMERLNQRTGANGFPPGKHPPTPKQVGHSVYRTPDEQQARLNRFTRDIEGPILVT